MKARLLRAAEFVLAGFAGVALCFYALSKLDGYAHARVALATVPAQSTLPAEATEYEIPQFSPVSHEQPTNVSLWSAKRILALERVIGMAPVQPIAQLHIRRISLYAPIFQDTSPMNLNRGVGWISGTSRPGESGNIGIAGHRDSFFRGLKDVAPGDDVELSSGGLTYVYRVAGTQIVYPQDTRVLDRDEDPSLTLVTCYPFYFVGNAPRRFVVKAHLVARLQTARTREAEKQIEP